jgi:hypothetical protein
MLTFYRSRNFYSRTLSVPHAGDIMLSAPGWVIHNHATETGATVLTVQDCLLQIALESLPWQETLKGPVVELAPSAGSRPTCKTRKPLQPLNMTEPKLSAAHIVEIRSTVQRS